MTHEMPMTPFRKLLALLVAAPLIAGAAPARAMPLQAARGGELWVDRYEPPGGSAWGELPLVAPDGGTVYAVGSVAGDHHQSGYRVAAFDPATGEQRWATEGRGRIEPRDAALSPDGATIYVVATERLDATTYEDWAIYALDTSDGGELWTARFGGIGRRDGPNDVAVAPDGSRVYLTGTNSKRKRHQYDFTTVSLDAATGEKIWMKRYDGPDHRIDEALGVQVAPDGTSLYVTGFSIVGNYDADYASVAYDAATGARKWVARYNGPGVKYSNDYPAGIVITPDGAGVVVTGQSTSSENHSEWFTVAYGTNDGAELWHDRFGPKPRRNGQPYGIAVAPDGSSVYVTGSSRVEGEDASTLAYRTADGTRAWEARYDAAGDQDTGWRVAASPDGERVYVTTMSDFEDKRPPDFVTLGYSSRAGALEWSARFGTDASNDYFPTLAIQPDSARVFVVGTQWDDEGTAFATFAYEPPRS